MNENFFSMQQMTGKPVITRFSKPTVWDTLKKGTVVEVFADDPLDENTYYIQRSADENLPLWEKI